MTTPPISVPIPMRFLAAVDEGIAFLDRRYPQWIEAIDLGTLDLNDCTTCVLGQVFNDYNRGLDLLDIDDPYELGFCLDETAEIGLALETGAIVRSDNEGGQLAELQWEELTLAWKARLRVRLGV